MNSKSYRTSAASQVQPAPKKAKTLNSWFSRNSTAPEGSKTSDPTALVINSSPDASFKGEILNVEYDLPGTAHSGEGRTIMIELDNLYIVACYVPNSGQILERLNYRTQEW